MTNKAFDMDPYMFRKLVELAKGPLRKAEKRVRIGSENCSGTLPEHCRNSSGNGG